MGLKAETGRNYETYTRISRRNGMSIPALKNHLRSAGLLNGDAPTQIAIASGAAHEKALTDDAYGNGKTTFFLWDRDVVQGILEEANATGNAGFGIWHAHAAVDRLHQVGHLINGNAPSDDVAEWCIMESSIPVLASAEGDPGYWAIMTRMEPKIRKAIIGKPDGQAKSDAMRHFENVYRWLRARPAIRAIEASA